VYLLNMYLVAVMYLLLVHIRSYFTKCAMCRKTVDYWFICILRVLYSFYL